MVFYANGLDVAVVFAIASNAVGVAFPLLPLCSNNTPRFYLIPAYTLPLYVSVVVLTTFYNSSPVIYVFQNLLCCGSLSDGLSDF